MRAAADVVGDVVRALEKDDCFAATRQTLENLLSYLAQLVIDRAPTAGVRIIGGTILPRGAEKAWNADMEKVRKAVNDWIRHKANSTASSISMP